MSPTLLSSLSKIINRHHLLKVCSQLCVRTGAHGALERFHIVPHQGRPAGSAAGGSVPSVVRIRTAARPSGMGM